MRFVLRGSATLLAVLAVAACSDAGRALQPNVIVLLSDQHRWQSMGHSEMPELQTPSLDRLAAEGASFTHAISNYPLCAPFRAMLLSGRWPYQTGVIDNGFGLRAHEPTIATAFRSAGYVTGYVGKLHLGNWTATAFGFDHSIVWQDSDDHSGGRWVGAIRDQWQHNDRGYNATVMSQQALDFVEEHRSVPWLLMLSWNPPHAIFTDAPAEKQALYPEGTLSYRRNYRPPPQLPSPFETYRGYHAHVSAIDDEIERVLAELEALDLDRRTIVIYTSDHGAMQGSFGLTNKRFPYEESIRIPFLVRAPGLVAPGTQVDAVFGAIDMAPTIAGLAGVPPLPNWVGQDHSPRLRGEPGPEPTGQPIFHILNRRTEHLPAARRPAPRFRGIRTPRWTYAVQADGPWLLFDNQADPYQLDNLVAAPDHARTRSELADQIAAWLVAAEDPFVLPPSAWQ